MSPTRRITMPLVAFPSLLVFFIAVLTVPAQAATPPHLVQTALVQRTPVVITRERTGTLKARRIARIFTQEAGRLLTLPYFEGDPIEQGTLLVQLDDRLLQAELDKAIALRRQARDEARRIEAMNDKRLTSQDERSRMRTALEVAEAEVRLLRTRLGYYRISAPFTGIVTARLAEPGDAVRAQTHLLSLADPASLVTELSVSELLIPHLKNGDAVEVRIDALGDGVYPGRILRIHPTLDPRTRRGVVEVELQPVPPGAMAGQFCRVRFHSPPVPRLSIPWPAIQRDRQGTFVFLLGPQHQVQRRAIRTGIKFRERIEVLVGLSEGQAVVVKGFLGLRAGSPVQVQTPSL